MEFNDVIKKRKSTRSFERIKIDKKMVEQIKESLKYVPVARGRYDLFRVLFVQKEKTLSRINFIINNDEILKGAPVVIFIVYKVTPEHKISQLNQNTGIISYNISLKATDLNLGSLICNRGLELLNENAELRKELKLYKDEQIMAYLLIGNATEKQFVGTEHEINTKDL